MHYPASEPIIDPVLIRKYDASEPRYASYPTADRFVDAFGEAQLRQWLDKRNIGGFSLPLSVYVSSPQILSDFKYLEKELRIIDGLLGGERRISCMRWGGSTVAPSARADAAETMRLFGSRFEFDPRADITIGVDPRSCEHGYMEFLATLGYNCLSARYQGDEDTRRVLQEARENGFRSVRLELDWGRPHRSPDGFSDALERVIALEPDCIALPGHGSARSAEPAWQGYALAVGTLARAGYECAGIDRFARPGGRTVMQPESDVLGFGIGAIGRIGPTYYQDFQRPDDYRAALDEGRLPVQRGIELTADDLLRRSVIHSLTTNFRVSIESIEIAHLVDFKSYFTEEQADLRAMEADGLVELRRDWIVVTQRGRLLVGAIGQVFDKYLRTLWQGAASTKVI